MLTKITAKNQITLPKAVTNAVGLTEYFEVEARNGQIILTPVRIQRADAVRVKLAELDLQEQDVADAVAWRASPCERRGNDRQAVPRLRGKKGMRKREKNV